MKTITLIVPCYNEAETVEIFYQAIEQQFVQLPDYEFNILFINDGSRDNTLELIKALNAKDQRVKYVSLARNFGKEAAMLAGFDYAETEAAIIMDVDLQDPPSLIPELVAEWEKGYQDVYARRKHRDGETWFKKVSSKLYYRILQKLSDIPVLVDVGDFRLLDKECILALRQLRECQRYTKGMFSWIGFKKKEVLYDRDARIAGATKWNYWKLFRLALDGITSFSTVPLQISSVLGIVISVLSFVYMIWGIGKTLLWGDPVKGYPSLIAVVLFVSGIQLMILGILGSYLGKVYNESKQRPVYLVGEKAL